MIEALCYPIDGELLLRKKKSIRRELLEDGRERRPLRVAVLGGSTLEEPLVQLELFLLDKEFMPTFYRSGFSRYYEESVFENSALEAFAPEIIIVHTNLYNLPQRFDIKTQEQFAQRLREVTGQFLSIWDSLQKRYGCPVIQNTFERPLVRPMGDRDIWDSLGESAFVRQVNEFFYKQASLRFDLHLHDLEHLSACFGLEAWVDEAAWYAYRYAFAPAAMPYYGFSLAGLMQGIFGKSKRALILDLDNTLWGGIIGEDGLSGIMLSGESPVGEAYLELQQYVCRLKEQGIVLGVCSKNQMEQALLGFSHPNALLKPEDFAAFSANWRPKPERIEEMANKLSLPSMHFVFLDDSPQEQQGVRELCPDVSVPHWSGIDRAVRILDRSGYFQPQPKTAEDTVRGEMYQQNATRQNEQARFTDYTQYLESLEMKARVSLVTQTSFLRALQLANKTNQFNLTGKGYSQQELETLTQSAEGLCLCGQLSDRFGDNGIVSVLICEQQGTILIIRAWYMSCRVLGRTLENTMLEALCRKAAAREILEIRGSYLPTAKNKPVEDLLERLGFSPPALGHKEWVYPLNIKTEPYINPLIQLMMDPSDE